MLHRLSKAAARFEMILRLHAARNPLVQVSTAFKEERSTKANPNLPWTLLKFLRPLLSSQMAACPDSRLCPESPIRCNERLCLAVEEVETQVFIWSYGTMIFVIGVYVFFLTTTNNLLLQGIFLNLVMVTSVLFLLLLVLPFSVTSTTTTVDPYLLSFSTFLLTSQP